MLSKARKVNDGLSSHLRDLTKKIRDFDDNFVVSACAAERTALDFFRSIDTPVSLGLYLRLKHGEYAQLIDVDIDPLSYSDGFRFRDDYQSVMLLKKYKDFPIDIDRKSVAIKKFLRTEEQMKEVNKRFSNLTQDALYRGINATRFSAMCEKIQVILAEPLTAEELFEHGGWGPGTTRTVKGREISAFNKFHSGNGITRDAFEVIADSFPLAYPGWTNELLCGDPLPLKPKHFRFFEGNKVSTVDKNSKTDRVIATEPDINMWFQKSIGHGIRRRLLRVGIDLNDQTRNQNLSYLASIDGHLTTVDFSSASDTISRELVRSVFSAPDHRGRGTERWFTLMDIFRSKYGEIDGQIGLWEKFSSMGNGFTFELETLLFLAAALVICDEASLPTTDVSVYGDDVVLPTSAYPAYAEFCSFLGFTVNKEKSHHLGDLRESCGEHYFAGLNCRPFYIRENYESSESVLHVANGVRILAHRRNNYYGCDYRFQHCWQRVVNRLPKPFRLRTPVSLGDSGLVSNFDEACPSRASDGIEGFQVVAFSANPTTVTTCRHALLQARLYDLGLPARVPIGLLPHFHKQDATMSRLWRVRTDYLRKKEIDAVFSYIRVRDTVSLGNEYSLNEETVPKKAVCSLVSMWYELGPWN